MWHRAKANHLYNEIRGLRENWAPRQRRSCMKISTLKPTAGGPEKFASTGWVLSGGCACKSLLQPSATEEGPEKAR